MQPGASFVVDNQKERDSALRTARRWHIETTSELITKGKHKGKYRLWRTA